MKKMVKLFLILCMIVFVFVACDKAYKRVLYKVQTGDSINVILNTDDGYSMTTELPIEFTHDETVIGTGIFITAKSYEDIINSTTKGIVIESGDKNGVHYVFYEYNNKEFNYIMKINNSNTGFVFSNSISREVAQECFERLTFSKE